MALTQSIQFSHNKLACCTASVCVQGRMHLAWDYLHMVADNGNVALLELRERIYNTGSADIPADAAPPVLPYQQESVVPQALPAGIVGTECYAFGHEQNASRH